MRDVCRMTVRGKFETCLLFVFGGSKRGRFERTSRALVMSHETCSCVYLLLCVKEKKTRNVYLHEGDTCDSFVPVTSQPRSQPHLLSSSRVLSFPAAIAASVDGTFRGDGSERRKQAVRGPMGKLLSSCTSSTWFPRARRVCGASLRRSYLPRQACFVPLGLPDCERSGSRTYPFSCVLNESTTILET